MMPPRIVLRSVPEDDEEAKITELQAKYPAQCKAIKAPATRLYDYFDYYDQQLHGADFLRHVIDTICVRNLARRKAVLDYAQDWAQMNPMAFEFVLAYGLNAFAEDDVAEYGEEFLQEALEELQLRRTQQHDAGLYILTFIAGVCH